MAPDLGGDVDDAGGVQAELGGQGAVDEGDGSGDAGVDLLAEDVDRLGQEHAVDAVGEVGVLAADVFLAEGVFDDAGGAEQDLLERGVFSAGRIGDLLRA